jgi:hypothetical protein
MGKVEGARVDSRVVIALLQVPLHQLRHVDTHGWVIERGTLEVDVGVI